LHSVAQSKGSVQYTCVDFWVMMPCSVVRSMLQPSSWIQHGPLKRWYATTNLHGITTWKTSTWNITAVKASKLKYFWLSGNHFRSFSPWSSLRAVDPVIYIMASPSA